ncbi:SOS response-associated peptidase [Aurantimonas marianensis]|nr:SOS response-associated peptidase [Aurantimonas marianensis]
MCGRFTLTASPETMAEMLALAEIEPFPPRYNIAPTQPILLVIGGQADRPEANSPDRTAVLARWGFIPSWVKEWRSFPLLFNARAETAAEKNSFRAAMRHRRCLIPASGFYEWRRREKAKSEAYFLRPGDGLPFCFAGVMETWLGADGSEVDTAAILTTAANRRIAPIHERMPVVVNPSDHARWLNCRENDPASIADVLNAANDDFFDPVRVTDRVNAVANTDPDIQRPIAGAESLPTEDDELGEDQPRLL